MENKLVFLLLLSQTSFIHKGCAVPEQWKETVRGTRMAEKFQDPSSHSGTILTLPFTGSFYRDLEVGMTNQALQLCKYNFIHPYTSSTVMYWTLT